MNIIFWILLVLIILAIPIWGYLRPMMQIASAYAAKVTCSAIFLSGRTLPSIKQDELHFLKFVRLHVYLEKKRVDTDILGGFKRAAIQTGWGGCTLVPLKGQLNLPPATDLQRPAFVPLAWAGAEPLRSWQLSKLNKVVEGGIAENKRGLRKNTRALVVLYQGNLIGEGYGKGFTQQMRLAGWSVTKSVTNALVGILVQQGKLSLSTRPNFPEWQQDSRSEITVEHLLRMNSGLAFNELYDRPADATNMLFLHADAAQYAAAKRLKHPVGKHWNYASGTTNLLCRLIREHFERHEDYLRFPYEALFEKIDMHSAVMETDANGTFIGSSFMMATAHDWARFGQLYLQNGQWKGEQILPEWWAGFSASCTEQSEAGQYAAHFWRNADRPVKGSQKYMGEGLPQDLYYASGFEEQRIAIIPSEELVVVRLGVTWPPKTWNFGPLLREILACKA